MKYLYIFLFLVAVLVTNTQVIDDSQGSGKYIYELLGILGMILCLINYQNGKSSNQLLATKITKRIKGTFDANFQHVGVTNQEYGAQLDETSSNSFIFYATGRINCHYCMLQMDFKKRQDFLTSYLLSMVWPEKDRLYFDFALDIPNINPLVFAVIRQREWKKTLEAQPDLKNLCQKFSDNSFSSSFVILAENNESVDFILDKAVKQTLVKYEKIISQIVITDQKSLMNFPLTLRLIVDLPQNTNNFFAEQENSLETISKMLFYLIDKLPNFRLSTTAKNNCDRERLKYEELKNKEQKEKKQEELQKKKLEKKQKEEEKFASLSIEKQRKLEEKEKKMQLKKKFPKKMLKY